MNVVKFPGNQQCVKVHGYLDSYLSNELLVETTHDVLRHLESCTECRQALADRQKVRDGLRRVVLAETLPIGLETRISAQLREQTGANIRRAWFFTPWALVAACLMLTVAVSSTVHRQKALAASQILALGLGDHITCAMGGHYPPTPPDMATVADEDNMGAQYALLVPAALKQLSQFQLVEGHRCHVGGRIYPHVILRQGDMLVSLSLVERKNGEAFPQGLWNGATKIDGQSVFQGHQEKYSVAGFATAKHFVFVSSALDEQSNFDLARRMVPATTEILRPIEASLRKPVTMVLAWLASGSFQPAAVSHP